MSRKKWELPQVDTADCRACGEARPLSEYRLFSNEPKRYMDFCARCEQKHGTLTLYRRYNAYGTPEIVSAVFGISRIPQSRRSLDQARLLVEPDTTLPPETTEEVVQRELARRDLARRRLLFFATTMMPNYQPGWVHQDICRRLEQFMRDVENELSPRLMICVPPRHGKSQLASDFFPSWALGHHPDWPIIATSYAQSLPVKFSRNIRDRLNDPEYQAIFPNARLRADAKGVEEWFTTRGGGLVAAGVGTGITGKGFKIGIVDDPIKDQEEAQSDLIRENTFDWYQAVFRTRVAPGAGILLINTRWHFDDVSGRLLSADEQLAKSGVPASERENWTVISYPAIADSDEFLMRDGSIERDVEDQSRVLRLLRRKGEALHPERYPLREMLKIKNSLTSSMWSALYQQSPTPEEGDFFKRDDFVYRWLDPEFRKLATLFMTVDYAIGKKSRNDYTVAGVWALDSNDDLYLIDARRGRWGTNDIVSNVTAMIEQYRPQVYAGEQGQIHLAVWPLIEADLLKKRIFITVDNSLTPMQDKEVRARPLQGRMQRRKLIFSYDGATKPEVFDIVERELLQFPNGVNDDAVDMMAWAARLAQNLPLPRALAPPPRPKSWRDKLIPRRGEQSAMAS